MLQYIFYIIYVTVYNYVTLPPIRLWPTIIATVESMKKLKAGRSTGAGDERPSLQILPSVDLMVSDALKTVGLPSV